MMFIGVWIRDLQTSDRITRFVRLDCLGRSGPEPLAHQTKGARHCAG
jgi:hypothetical protein